MRTLKSKRWLAIMAGAFIGCGTLVGVQNIAVPIAHAENAVTNSSPTQLFPALEGIELTSAQQTQIQALSDQTLPEIQSVLTPEQQEKFEQAIAQGSEVRVALSSLGLTSDQQRQLQSILQSVQSELEEILTPEQQRQLRRTAIKSRRQRP